MLSSETEDWLRRHGVKCVSAVLVLAAGWWLYGMWSRPPAIEFDNLKYVQLLTTAVSSRNSEWLAKVDTAVTQRHTAGEMSDHERQAFQTILATAAAGQWSQAERECDALARAQLHRRRAKPPSADPAHDHDHSHGNPAQRLTAN